RDAEGPAQPGEEGGDADRGQDPEGERDVPVHREDDRPGDEDRGEAEDERRRGRARARRPRDQRSGQEHGRSRAGETKVLADDAHGSSAGTSPEARKRAPSR